MQHICYSSAIDNWDRHDKHVPDCSDCASLCRERLFATYIAVTPIDPMWPPYNPCPPSLRQFSSLKRFESTQHTLYAGYKENPRSNSKHLSLPCVHILCLGPGKNMCTFSSLKQPPLLCEPDIHYLTVDEGFFSLNTSHKLF